MADDLIIRPTCKIFVPFVLCLKNIFSIIFVVLFFPHFMTTEPALPPLTRSRDITPSAPAAHKGLTSYLPETLQTYGDPTELFLKLC